MAQAPTSTNIIIGGDIPDNIDSFARHIRAENLSPATLDAYVGATQQFYRYLVAKGMPFREAHGVVTRLSAAALQQGKGFHELSLETYRGLSDLFDEDVLGITVDSSVAARNVPGGTSPVQVARAIADARAALEAEDGG